MRARNLGNIGVAAAIVLGLVIAVFAGTKLMSTPRLLELEETTSLPSRLPTMMPSFSSAPTSQPSALPSIEPSASPSVSKSPSRQPSLRPSISAAPSTQPSSTPSVSAMPSESPSFIPSAIPSASSAPSSEFFGTRTTIFLDSRSNSAMVAVLLIIALTYASLYMCGKDNQSKDICVDKNVFGDIFHKSDRQYESDPECEEPEILSKSIPRHKSDDTIDTNNVYPMNCAANNSINTRVREMGMESPNCDGIILCSSPMQSNVDSFSEADTKMQDIDLEDGRGGILPNSVAISKKISSPFKSSGISPLRTPKIFKKRKHGKTKDAKLRNKQDRNSSVYARGNTPLRNTSRQKQGRNHSLADDMMDENDQKPPKGSPVSFDTSAKDDLIRDRPKENDVSSPDGEGGVECLAYEQQKKRKVDVYNLHKDKSLRHLETITISSDGSSTIEWDDDLASPPRPSFGNHLRDFDDTKVEMESHGIEVSARYESDDID